MWRPFRRGCTAVKNTFRRQWFRHTRVDAIDAESDVSSVAASVDRCNRCECPRSCACYCHATTGNVPPPSRISPQSSSQNFVCSDDSAQGRANQELAEADNRNDNSSCPCSLSISPASPPDYGNVQSSQLSDGILFGSPRASSYLSYATIQRPLSQDDGRREESLIVLPSGSPSLRSCPYLCGRQGVVSLPSVASPPHHAVQTPVEDNVASAGAQSHHTTTVNSVGTGATNRSSIATATTVAASLFEATEDLLNFPEVGQGLSNELFSPASPPTGLLQQNVSQASTSHVVNHNGLSSDQASLPNVPLPIGYSTRSGGYTNPNRANLDPLEFSGETLRGVRARTYNIGADNALGSGQAASSTSVNHSVRVGTSGQRTSEPSHLVGHALLDAMEGAGGYSTPRSQSTRLSPQDYAYTTRLNMVLEVTRLGLHLGSVIDHYIQRVMAGATRSWSLGRRSQRQVSLGLIYLQRLINMMSQHAFSMSGAQVFAILEVLLAFEGDLNRLTTSLDRSSDGPDVSLVFTLSCIALPDDLNRLYEDYEERFRRIRMFFFS